MTRRRNRQRRVAVALGLAASLAVAAVELTGVLQPLEAVVMDFQMRLRGPLPVDERIAIVAVDEASIDLLGRWPWPRTCLASIVDRLEEAGAKVIAFDLVLSEPTRSPPGVDLSGEDQALADALGRAGSVVLGYFFRRESSQERLPGSPLADLSAADLNAADPGAANPGAANPGAVSLGAAALEVRGSACYAPPSDGSGSSSQSLAPWSFQVVLGGPYPVPRRPAVEPNLDLFTESSAAQGFFSHERQEGVQRRYELVNTYEGRYFPALALAAAARYLDAGLELRPHHGGLPEVRIGERRVQADEAGRLWINHRGPAGTFPTYSAAALLAGEVPAEALEDRLVFLGATETGIGDVAATPFGAEVPGVEVHATVADNLLNGRYLHDTAVQRGWSLLALLLMGPLVGLLVALIERHLLGSLAAIALVLAWPVACHLFFVSAGWHLQVVSPVLAGVGALVLALRHQVGQTQERAQLIRNAFQRYVSEAVVEKMLQDPEGSLTLGGEERELTVLFSDIRGFTTLSEGLPPEAVVQLLNEFFTPMTRLVLDAGGTLDKYMGDALMAFFGAPVEQADHARRACRAALAMRDELKRLNARWRQEGRFTSSLEDPSPDTTSEDAGKGEAELGIGIGLNSGEMSVGNMGSDQIFDYTVIGDNVNLGSRIEGLNKVYGTEILCSAATAEAAGDAFLFRELDRVRVKGKELPVVLYELMAAEPSPKALKQRAEAFTTGMTAYRQRRFEDAEEIFTQLLEEDGDDGPSALYRERCRAHQAAPPADDWEAVEVMTSK